MSGYLSAFGRRRQHFRKIPSPSGVKQLGEAHIDHIDRSQALLKKVLFQDTDFLLRGVVLSVLSWYGIFLLLGSYDNLRKTPIRSDSLSLTGRYTHRRMA